MENIDVVFIYERVARELDVACAIKYLLKARHNLRLEILQRPHGYRPFLDQFSPKIICLPFCYGHSLIHHPFLYDWPKAACVNLAWEELLYEGNRQMKMPQGDFDLHNVYHHAWGDFFGETLQELGVPANLIFTNGNPTYALYESPYKDYFASRAELARRYNLDPRKRWVFFPENYNWAFYTEGELKDFVELGGLDRTAMAQMAAFCRQSLEDVLRWCEGVTRSEQIEFILRPRPTTPLDRFKDVVSRSQPALLDRLHILKDESIREWNLASEVVISSYSTSLIEAAVAGKQVYMVEPVPLLPELQSPWHAYLPHLTSQLEFERACLSDLGVNENALSQWAKATMLAHGDPIYNISEFLAGLCTGKIPLPPRPKHSKFLRRSWFKFLYYRFSQARARREIDSWNDPYYEREIVSQEEINARVSRWAPLLANYQGSSSRPQSPSAQPAPILQGAV